MALYIRRERREARLRASVWDMPAIEQDAGIISSFFDLRVELPSLNRDIARVAQQPNAVRCNDGDGSKCMRGSFLELPAEVRNVIYELAAGNKTRKRPVLRHLRPGRSQWSSWRQAEKLRQERERTDPEWPYDCPMSLRPLFPAASPLGLLLSCRRVYRELAPYFYSETAHCFMFGSHLGLEVLGAMFNSSTSRTILGSMGAISIAVPRQTTRHFADQWTSALASLEDSTRATGCLKSFTLTFQNFPAPCYHIFNKVDPGLTFTTTRDSTGVNAAHSVGSDCVDEMLVELDKDLRFAQALARFQGLKALYVRNCSNGPLLQRLDELVDRNLGLRKAVFYTIEKDGETHPLGFYRTKNFAMFDAIYDRNETDAPGEPDGRLQDGTATESRPRLLEDELAHQRTLGYMKWTPGWRHR